MPPVSPAEYPLTPAPFPSCRRPDASAGPSAHCRRECPPPPSFQEHWPFRRAHLFPRQQPEQHGAEFAQGDPVSRHTTRTVGRTAAAARVVGARGDAAAWLDPAGDGGAPPLAAVPGGGVTRAASAESLCLAVAAVGAPAAAAATAAATTSSTATMQRVDRRNWRAMACGVVWDRRRRGAMSLGS